MRGSPLLVLALLACGGSDPGKPQPSAAPRPDKVYVCAQEAGTIDVLDGETLEPLTRIDTGMGRAPHNATVGPRGDQVWVSNADGAQTVEDEVLVIDPATDQITKRITLDAGAYVQHVLVSPDGGIAYVTGFGSNLLYRIDARTYERLADIPLPNGAAPHGMHFSPDGAFLYLANGAGSVGEVDLAAGRYAREFRTPGGVIQVATHGDYVYATVFDPPRVARVTRATGDLAVWTLEDAKGPAQLEVSKDGTRLYVAEQGSRTEPGLRLLVLDAATGAIVDRHSVGRGPHGVAVSEDGAWAFVTSTFDASIVSIDLVQGKAMQLLKTSRGPYGVVLWSARGM